MLVLAIYRDPIDLGRDIINYQNPIKMDFTLTVAPCFPKMSTEIPLSTQRAFQILAVIKEKKALG